MRFSKCLNGGNIAGVVECRTFVRVYAVMKERIIPPERQNIRQILRDMGLMEYDEFEMLIYCSGRSCQDDFILEEIGKNKWKASIFKHPIDSSITRPVPRYEPGIITGISCPAAGIDAASRYARASWECRSAGQGGRQTLLPQVIVYKPCGILFSKKYIGVRNART